MESKHDIWYQMSKSYFKSALLICNTLQNSEVDMSLICPILYNTKHGIELYLKYVSTILEINKKYNHDLNLIFTSIINEVHSLKWYPIAILKNDKGILSPIYARNKLNQENNTVFGIWINKKNNANINEFIANKIKNNGLLLKENIAKIIPSKKAMQSIKTKIEYFYCNQFYFDKLQKKPEPDKNNEIFRYPHKLYEEHLIDDHFIKSIKSNDILDLEKKITAIQEGLEIITFFLIRAIL